MSETQVPSSQQDIDEHDIAPSGAGYRAIFRVALPLIISMGSFTAMQFFDRVFLARYNSDCIQAALPAGVLAFTLCSLFMELSGYATTFVAQFFGRGQLKDCSRASAQGLFMGLAAWPVMVAMIPFGCWILSTAGHAPEVMALEKTYLTILMLGGVHLPLGVAFGSLFSGRGQTRPVMFSNISANLVNIVLDYLLIFGKAGFPEMGMAGAAIATLVAGFFNVAILAALYFRPSVRLRFGTWETLRPDLALMARIFRFAWASSVHLMLEIMSFTVFILFMGRIGEMELAVGNMVFSINMLAFMPMLGLGQAATIIVGKFQGAGLSALAETAAWRTFRVGTIYSVLIGSTYILFPEFFLSFFVRGDDPGLAMADVVAIGRWMLVFTAVWGCFDAGNVIIAGALKGAGDTRFVMIYSLLMSWLVLVLGSWCLIEILDVGVLTAWAWLAFHIILLASGYLLRFRCGRWKTIDVLGPQAVPYPQPPLSPIPPE